MFNNVVLDVFIGLIFVFLLYSLLATILHEFIAKWMNLRARMLQKALRRMLEDDRGSVLETGLPQIGTETKKLFSRFLKPINKGSMLEKFYSHPTIKYLGENKLFSKPSYLHAHNFSQTLIHLLRGKDYDGRTTKESELIWKELKENKLNINEETRTNLINLFADARQDSFVFKNKLEDWFEETMERASGWYKKQTQTILLIIGFGIAVLFNVDTIAIAKILMKDKKAREQMVQLAMSKQEQYGALLDSTQKVKITKTSIINGDTIITSFDSTIKEPISDKFLETTYNELNKDATDVMGVLGLRGIADKKSKSKYQDSWLLIFFGWLLTGFAISLGASFWFDLLNKFIKLRENGAKPASTALQDKPAGTTAGGNAIKGSDGTPVEG